jgi:tetratricopeptide (TPR) repeat protein
MMQRMKAGLVATTIAAVAIVPVAGLVTLATAEAAHAKGEGNGGGGGNGNGDRGHGGADARGGQSEARGGGRPDWAGGQRNGGDNGNRGGGRSDSARGGSDPISSFIRGLTGEQRQEARAQARTEARAARKAPTENAPQASIAPVKRPARSSDMHPSELGNMNGALNANINAVLAHIRNGNANGPVGGLAALAVADAALADAERVLNEAVLAEALGEDYASVQAYYDSGAHDEDINAALVALGVNPDFGEDYKFTPPTEVEVMAAEESLPMLVEDQLAAEDNMLSLWNKNGDADADERQARKRRCWRTFATASWSMKLRSRGRSATGTAV